MKFGDDDGENQVSAIGGQKDFSPLSSQEKAQSLLSIELALSSLARPTKKHRFIV